MVLIGIERGISDALLPENGIRSGGFRMKASRFTFAAVMCVTVVLLLSGPVCANAEPQLYRTARRIARTEIWNDINSGRAGSATVAILDGGEVVYAEGFAMADRENSVPVDPATVFNIGSVSKVYVATAVMLLVDEGKIGLDAPAVRYLPEFFMADPRYVGITVRMLLNHSSGLPGTVAAGNIGFQYNAAVHQEMLAVLSRTCLKHDPGAMAIYCNDGFTLAEMIVERVSGQKYIDFLASRIFEPLALSDTGASVGDRTIRRTAAEVVAAYYRPMTGQKEPLEAVSHLGSGGLSATAMDLVRFADSFSDAGRHILSEPALREMRKNQPSSSPAKLRNPNLAYGLGWDMTYIPKYREQGIQVLGKSGGTGNYNSMVYTVPDERISVAVIETGPAGRSVEIALEILDAVLVEKGLVKEKMLLVSVPPKPEVIPDEYAAYCGYYILSGGRLASVNLDRTADRFRVSSVIGGVEVPALCLYYSKGAFYRDDSGGMQLYFTMVDGEQYAVEPFVGFDMAFMRRLPAIEVPFSMEMDMNGKRWLRRNVKPFEGAFLIDSHLVQSCTIEALPGYVDFCGIKKIESPTYAGMPAGATRDLGDLTLLHNDGETWAQVLDMLYSPADSTATLSIGANVVTIGDSGYSEWLRAAHDSVLTFQIPAGGRTFVFATDGSPKYDSSVDEGDVFVNEGDFVEISGAPTDQFTIECEAAYR